MKVKKLGAALVVVAALGAVLASSALAAVTTTDVKWYIGASPGTELTGSEAVVAKQEGTGTFATTVSGQAVVIHQTGTECIECKIENSGGTAVGSGKLKFTGVTVEKPAGCTTSSSITTKSLTWQADWMVGTTAYWRFRPTAGAETAWYALELTGASCPLKTSLTPKGTLYFEALNATAVLSEIQEITAEKGAGEKTPEEFKNGVEPAEVTTRFNVTILSRDEYGTAE